jgi:hypothetical protein
MVKKLVTIFAGHLDSFIVINNHFKLLKTTVTSGSGQISTQMTLIRFAGTGKNCAIPVLHRDNFPGLPGQGQSRLLRQLTFPNHIAVPLVQIAFKLSHIFKASIYAFSVARPPAIIDIYQLSNQDITSMTIYNDLQTVTLTSPDLNNAQYLDQ